MNIIEAEELVQNGPTGTGHRRLDQIARVLIRKGVPMVLKTLYEDNKPKVTEWMKSPLEKRGHFFYIAGVRVSRFLAQEAAAVGLIGPA